MFFEADGLTHSRCLRKQTKQQMFQTTDGRVLHAWMILLFVFHAVLIPLLMPLAYLFKVTHFSQ